jgi:CubicO group peptidase (beta-lactamase class C family)
MSKLDEVAGVTTARYDLGAGPGRFGWNGAFGTSWHVDPREHVVGVLMIQRRPDKLSLPPITQDFWTSVYQLIEP